MLRRNVGHMSHQPARRLPAAGGLRSPRRWARSCARAARSSRSAGSRFAPLATAGPAARRRTPSGPGRASATRCCWCPGFLAGDGTLALMARSLRGRGLPHLPLPHPRQRRLHAQRRRPARGAAGVDRDPARLPGPGRRAQPGRHARPRGRRTPSRPGLQRRHPRQPDARARRPPPLAERERGDAGAAEQGRCARPDGRGLRRRCLCAAELRGVPRAAAGRHRLHRESTPGATASSTGGPASTRSRARSR